MKTFHGPPKLAACAAHGPGSGAELFVVEGDSASAAVARVRDAAFQAVLPMQGKPLNARRAAAAKVAVQPLYAALAEALGTGIGSGGDAAAVRYDRILLLMDPDADGIHCGLLLVIFFMRWLRPLLAAGRIEVVRPPWGEVVVEDGRPPRLAFSDAEYESLVGLARRSSADGGPPAARRYRGLAGIDAAVLRDTCVAPATRRTSRITVADAEAMIAVFDRLGTPDGPAG